MNQSTKDSNAAQRRYATLSGNEMKVVSCRGNKVILPNKDKKMSTFEQVTNKGLPLTVESHLLKGNLVINAHYGIV